MGLNKTCYSNKSKTTQFAIIIYFLRIFSVQLLFQSSIVTKTKEKKIIKIINDILGFKYKFTGLYKMANSGPILAKATDP